MRPSGRRAQLPPPTDGSGGLVWATQARGLVTIASEDESLLDAAREACGRRGFVACLLGGRDLTLAALLRTQPDLVVLDGPTAARLCSAPDGQLAASTLLAASVPIVICLANGTDAAAPPWPIDLPVVDLGTVVDGLLVEPTPAA